MTAGELEEQIDRAVGAFMELEGMTDDLAQRLVEQGYLSYDDLSVVEPDALMEMGGMTAEQVDAIVEQADERALVAEKAADEAKKLKRELAMAEAVAATKAAMSPPPPAVDQASATEAGEETPGEETSAAGTTADDAAGNAASSSPATGDEPVKAAVAETADADDASELKDTPDNVSADNSSAELTDESTTGQDHGDSQETSPVANAPEETMDQTNVADRN